FVGIFIGLQDFNVENIVDSVPFLLEGLKTAFYTSILGMTLAIFLSIVQRGRALNTQKSPNDLLLDRFYKLDKLDSLDKLDKLDKLDNLDKLASLDKLESLITQNQQIYHLQESYHQAQNQNFTYLKESLVAINSSLKESMHHLAKNASSELIKALDTVIKEFNHSITEQFGDSFKEMNKAIGLMLQWQENYKEQIEHLNDKFKQSLKIFESSTQSLEMITQRDREILDVYQALGSSIEASRIESEKLIHLLSGFSQIHKDASEALHKVEDLVKVLEDSHSQTLNVTKGNLQYIQDFLIASSKEYQSNIQEMLALSLERLESDYRQSSKNLSHLQHQFEVFNQQYLSQNKEQLESLLGDLKDKMQNFIQEVYSADRDLKEKSFSVMFEIKANMQNKIEEIKNVFDKALDLLKAANGETLGLMESQSKRNAEVITQYTQNLETSLEKTHLNLRQMTEYTSEELIKNSKSVQDCLADVMIGVESLLSGTTKTLEENLTQSKQALIENSKEIEKTILTTTKDVDQFVNNTTNSLSVIIEDAASNLTNLVKNTTDSFSKNAYEVERVLSNSGESIARNVTKVADTIGNSIASLLEQNQDYSKNLQELMKENVEGFSKHIEEVFDTSSQAIIQNFTKVTDEISDTAHLFLEVHQADSKNLQELMKENVEGFSKHIKEVFDTSSQAIIQNFTKVTDEISDTAHLFLEVHQADSKNLQELMDCNVSNFDAYIKKTLAQSSDAIASNLNKVTHSIQSNVHSLLEQNQDYSKNLQGLMKENVEGFSKHIKEVFDTSSQAIIQNFTKIASDMG
ncbi:MAG: hypothetical protein K2I63_02245, partial [Helicobacter sp.]|nr:hypothetical protein [Helicobacter sp.]